MKTYEIWINLDCFSGFRRGATGANVNINNLTIRHIAGQKMRKTPGTVLPHASPTIFLWHSKTIHPNIVTLSVVWLQGSPKADAKQNHQLHVNTIVLTKITVHNCP